MRVCIANPLARWSRRSVAALHAITDLDVQWTSDTERAGVLTSQALETGATEIVVCGGDGTVRDVAERLAGTGVPLGIMPSGTANLYARNLDLPISAVSKAARIALGGRCGAADLGRVVVERGAERSDPKVFLVVVGVGHDAAAVEAASLKSKRRLGWTAYVHAGVRRFAAPLFDVHAVMDDGVAAHTSAWTVLVHNAARIPAGLHIVPGTRLDDGKLHVAVVSPTRWTHWGRIAASGMGIARAQGVLSHRVVETVRLEADNIPAQLDGDAIGAVTAIEAWVDPGILTVRLGGTA